MPSEASLNQLVKGAPTANIATPPPAPLPPLSSATEKYTPSPDLSALLPSSPPTIYLNLLILESSLRSQYLHLVSRRRLNTFFLLVLSVWTSAFGYLLFLQPREDGSGLGGSVYWLWEMLEKLGFMGGVATFLLVWATGQFERGYRWPRRWLSTTNRGLRPFNLRVVIMRRRWWREMFSHFSFLIPLGLFADEEGARFSDWHMVEHENGIIVEEDLAKGGDYIMLLLLPKSFSPEFRENWEEYRSEYWERENERRAVLRRKVKIQRRNKARDLGGWKWYTGLWRLMPRPSPPKRNQDLEKHPHHHHHGPGGQQHPHARNSSHTRTSNNGSGLSEKDALLLKDQKAHRRRSLRRDSSATGTNHSRQSSRSSTPAISEVDGSIDPADHDRRVRRGSSVSSTASVRRKTRELRSSAVGPLTSASGASSGGEERPRRNKVERVKEEDSAQGGGEYRPTTPDSDSGSVSATNVPDGPWAGSKAGAVKIKREESVGLGGVA